LFSNLYQTEEFPPLQSFENKINAFLKTITKAKTRYPAEILKLNDDKYAFVSTHSIKILTETQKELVELLIDGPRTGADLARLTEELPHLTKKSPQFISKYMTDLIKWGIVEHIEAPFGRSKFYVLKFDIKSEEEIKKVHNQVIPASIKKEIEKRGEVGSLMSLSFKEILDLIRELKDTEKQKVLDFIIDYCQEVEED